MKWLFDNTHWIVQCSEQQESPREDQRRSKKITGLRTLEAISKQSQIPRSSLQTVFHKYKLFECVTTLLRSGIRPKLYASDEMKLVSMFRNSPGTTKGLACHEIAEKPVSLSNFTFTVTHMDKPNAFKWWVETKFELWHMFGGVKMRFSNLRALLFCSQWYWYIVQSGWNTEKWGLTQIHQLHLKWTTKG